MTIKKSYSTKHQEELLNYMKSTAGTHITAGDICMHMRSEGKNIGTATVYRQLEKMVDEGIVNLAALHSSLSDRKITMTMLAVQLTGIKEKYRRDVVAAMFAVDETTQDIILELFPDATPSSKTFRDQGQH